MEILTDRLLLRAFVPEDQQIYAAMNLDTNVMRWLGGPRGTAETLVEIEYNNSTLTKLGYGKVAIERRSDGEFLGMCGLSVEPWYPDDLEIGWRLSPTHWGRGYATEAAHAWLSHAFEALGVARVISVSDTPNLPSIAVMKRLRMKLLQETELEIDGDRFEAAIYAINADEFAKNSHGT